jgi:hypothetical protein
MDINTFLVEVFCLVDDFLNPQRIRQRGKEPSLADSEVITMEVVGEFLGLDTDSGIYSYFYRHYLAWFPRLQRVDRTMFARQAANLWKVKEALWQHLLTRIDYDPHLSIVDSFPVPLARFGRAYRARRMRDWAAWGWDEVNKQPFWGLRAHLRICWPGVIVGLSLQPADVHDRWAVEDLLPDTSGYLLGDTNYWSPLLAHQLRTRHIVLVTPVKSSRRRFHHPWPHWLIQTRRRVETVISQLTERFHAKKVWAHDAWHCCARWIRKLLTHTLAFFFAQQAGLDSSLAFADLITD